MTPSIKLRPSSNGRSKLSTGGGELFEKYSVCFSISSINVHLCVYVGSQCSVSRADLLHRGESSLKEGHFFPWRNFLYVLSS